MTKPNPVCPNTGTPLHRAMRPMAFTYKGVESITFDMPG